MTTPAPAHRDSMERTARSLQLHARTIPASTVAPVWRRWLEVTPAAAPPATPAPTARRSWTAAATDPVWTVSPRWRRDLWRHLVAEMQTCTFEHVLVLTLMNRCTCGNLLQRERVWNVIPFTPCFWTAGCWTECFSLLQEVNVWTWARVSCAAVRQVSLVPTARSTSMTVPPVLARMQGPARMVWMTSPAPAPWATPARTAVCARMLAVSVLARMVALASLTSPGQYASALKGLWVRVVSSHFSPVSNLLCAKPPSPPLPLSPSPVFLPYWFWY